MKCTCVSGKLRMAVCEKVEQEVEVKGQVERSKNVAFSQSAVRYSKKDQIDVSKNGTALVPQYSTTGLLE